MTDETGDREVEEYLAIGLRLGRLLDGFVDCWYGGPELSHRVAVEPPADPGELAAQAARLRSGLPSSGLAARRQHYLAAQLTAVECSARRLGGAAVPFLAEVRDCFGVDIELGDTDRYASVHREMGSLLGRPGHLRSAVEEFYERNVIPPGKLLACTEAVSGELRDRVNVMFGLPDAERVVYEVVQGKPWNAFNRYLGGFQSLIQLNAEAGHTIAAMPLIVTHEAYAGHHTEHCRKEAGLADGLGHREHVISLVNTPQCLLAEGLAELAVTVTLGAGWGPWTAGILARHGVHVSGEQVEQVARLIRELMPVRQDAAIMLHDLGRDPEEVTGYLQRWLLLPRERAEQIVRFTTDPLWRAYSVTYVAGPQLVGEWLDARPDGTPAAERFQVLLDEPLLPGDLLPEATASRSAHDC